jgi:hypothetical protein
MNLGKTQTYEKRHKLNSALYIVGLGSHGWFRDSHRAQLVHPMFTQTAVHSTIPPSNPSIKSELSWLITSNWYFVRWPGFSWSDPMLVWTCHCSTFHPPNLNYLSWSYQRWKILFRLGQVFSVWPDVCWAVTPFPNFNSPGWSHQLWKMVDSYH